MKANWKIIMATLLVMLITASTSASNDSIVGGSPYLPDATFFYDTYQHPAAYFWMPNPNTGTVESNYYYEDRSNYHFLQEGTATNAFDLKAEGFTLKGNNAFWGKASYRNHQKQDVQWTDVSDVFRLGPYLIADSVGGKVYGEEYCLSGGFASKVNRITWGLEAGYRGGNEYRKRDPRPKTIVSDLYLKAGIGYELQNYQAGISLSGGIYKQSLSVLVEEDHVNYRFFSMKGFGQTDLLDSETSGNYNWDYRGKSAGISAFILPRNGKGIVGSIDYNNEYIDSYITPNKYPSTFTTNLFSGQLGYRSGNETVKRFLKADFMYQTGKGTERIYKDLTALEDVILIGEHKKYTRNVSALSLSGLQEWIMPSGNRWIEVRTGIHSYEERYASPAYKLKYSHMNISATGGIEKYIKKQASILTEISIEYLPLLSSETTVPSQERLFILSMQPNLDVLETSPLGAKLKVLYQFPVKNNVKLYVAAQGTTLIAQQNNDRYAVNLTIGFRY